MSCHTRFSVDDIIESNSHYSNVLVMSYKNTSSYCSMSKFIIKNDNSIAIQNTKMAKSDQFKC